MQAGFRLRKNAKNEHYLDVFGYWDPSLKDFIQENNIDYLMLSDGKWGDLSFLESVKNYIKKLVFHSHSDEEILGGLHYLFELESLSLEVVSKTPLDFSCFPKLKKCNLYWNKTFSENLFSIMGLEELTIRGWKSSNFAPFTNLKNLLELNIRQSGIIDTNGISALKQLEILVLYDLRKLVEMGDISNLEKLQKLDLGNCKKASSIDFISSLNALRHLSLYSMGRIRSLEFLNDLKNLETFFFDGSTIIEDGNLNILTELPNLNLIGFQNRKHYSHKNIDLRKLLENR